MSAEPPTPTVDELQTAIRRYRLQVYHLAKKAEEKLEAERKDGTDAGIASAWGAFDALRQALRLIPD